MSVPPVLAGHAITGAGARFTRVLVGAAPKNGTWRVRSNILINNGTPQLAASNPNFYKNWKFTDPKLAQQAIDALQANGKFHSLENDCNRSQFETWLNPTDVMKIL